MLPNEAFLSHSSKDKEFVSKLAAELRRHGIPILYQSCDYERLSWVLPSFQIIHFQKAFEDGCRNLLRLWGIGYQLSQ